MRVSLNGLAFETPCVTFYLWSPWRASALEHRLFDAVHSLPGAEADEAPDERRVHVTDPMTWEAALQGLARVVKGWQEDADPGGERRSWRWLLEGDTDADGFDTSGEPTSLWGLLQVSVSRGGPGEPDTGEDIDLEGFGFRIWGEDAAR